MDDLFLLSEVQFNRIRRYFPLSHGVPRVDDLRVVSGIIYFIKHGLQWKDAPRAMVRTRRFITASCAGAGWVFSIGFSPLWPRRPVIRSN